MDYELKNMARTKLIKFRDNAVTDKVVEPGKPLYERISGLWRAEMFGNDNPIVLELACGMGEYTVGMAQIFPEKNFIGVDIKGSRLWSGSNSSRLEGLTNTAFLRAQIQSIDRFFDEDEVDEIWIIFPDPRPRLREARKRLTHPRFLNMYRYIMKPGGLIHLKTDNGPLFDFTLDVLHERDDVLDLVYTRDLYGSELLGEHFGITTKYEMIHSGDGNSIKYLRFRMGE
jgi:tRNA (guanine-N7-)-methyltransferase